ncbi:MAG: iron ABC transporter permease [Acidobacteriota bacterium]
MSASASSNLRPRFGAILILVALLFLAIIFAVTVGAADVSMATAFREAGTARSILFQLRVPRVLVAALVGAVLAISGVTFQTLLRNPLADPFILGVSGGAACGGALATAIGLASIPGIVPLAAFGGACLAIAAVLALGRTRRGTDPARLLLAGLVLNALFSALILLALSLTRGNDLTAALRWMMGTFFTATWRDVAMLSVTLAAAFLILTAVGGDLRMMVFGEEDARSRGVNTERVTLLSFLAASIATGAAVSVSGIIGFVGLLVPHAVRMIWRRDFRFQLPLNALAGALLLVVADALSRMVIAPSELPIGALTALLGVPFFLLLLRRRLG